MIPHNLIITKPAPTGGLFIYNRPKDPKRP